ncbi:hypothetical protein OS242_11030 [Tumebacillus sp. DT12]|uniref:Uncharacterized protein n=1 Tax=Tumebacillus lacus TaxID=2995335 RepID=A0ABT3X0S7_9BACL|nr:hypothetical protein [Tumebacillus lacus]MCX7570495.1 hypothetical protein [Tumebacillus lacus]
MSLSKTEADQLFKLGFKRAEYSDEVYPQDVFEYQNSIWVVGGRILPSGNILCDEKIYKEGTWIPSLPDLITWVEDHDCKFETSYCGLSYKVTVTDSSAINYKGSGSTLEFAMFHVIKKILEKYGGNPVSKSYVVLEAQLVDDIDK